MAATQLTNAKEFETVIKKGVTLIDFNAPWCGPCQAQAPILKKVSGKFAGRALVAEMNIDTNQDTASRYFVQSIPTLIIFKDGKEVKRFIGFQGEHVLTSALEGSLN